MKSDDQAHVMAPSSSPYTDCIKHSLRSRTQHDMSSEATLHRKCIVAHLWQTLSSDVCSHVGWYFLFVVYNITTYNMESTA